MHVTQDGPASPRPSTARRRGLFAVAGMLLLAGATLLVAGTASAQTVPTVPCPGCGPGPVGDGTRPWSYTEFVCIPQRGFVLQFGNGRNVGEPVNVLAGIAVLGTNPVPVNLVAADMAPGQRSSVTLPAPSDQAAMLVRIVARGVQSGRTLLDNTRELDCVCNNVVTTTTTTTPTTTPTTGPTTTPTTTPTTSPTSIGTTTSTAPENVTTTTPTVSPTTIPGTLPETGGGGGAMPMAGAVLVLFGAAVLAVTAFRRPERTG
jgi:hypothetical protein